MLWEHGRAAREVSWGSRWQGSRGRGCSSSRGSRDRGSAHPRQGTGKVSIDRQADSWI